MYSTIYKIEGLVESGMTDKLLSNRFINSTIKRLFMCSTIYRIEGLVESGIMDKILANSFINTTFCENPKKQIKESQLKAMELKDFYGILSLYGIGEILYLGCKWECDSNKVRAVTVISRWGSNRLMAVTVVVYRFSIW